MRMSICFYTFTEVPYRNSDTVAYNGKNKQLIFELKKPNAPSQRKCEEWLLSHFK